MALSVLPAADSGMGKKLPAEWETYKDKQTGAEITLVTTSEAKDWNIYQTHPSWTPDSKLLLFYSDRSGTTRYYACLMETGELIPVTDDRSMKVDSLTLSRKANLCWAYSGTELFSIDLDALVASADGGQDSSSLRRPVSTVPEGLRVSGMLTLDGGDKRLSYIATTEDGYSEIITHSPPTATGKVIYRTKTRLGHLQSNPVDPDWLMFCHETGGDAEQRMWLIRSDGSRCQPFFPEKPGEWITHEVWWGGKEVLFTSWPRCIAKVGLKKRLPQVLSEDKYWHVGGDPNLRWIAGDKFTGEIYLINPFSGKRKLLTAGHRPEGAKNHPHISFSPDGSKVLFCTSIRGNWDLAFADVNSLKW